MSRPLQRALIARHIGDRVGGIFARDAVPELRIICDTKHGVPLCAQASSICGGIGNFGWQSARCGVTKRKIPACSPLLESRDRDAGQQPEHAAEHARQMCGVARSRHLSPAVRTSSRLAMLSAACCSARPQLEPAKRQSRRRLEAAQRARSLHPEISHQFVLRHTPHRIGLHLQHDLRDLRRQRIGPEREPCAQFRRRAGIAAK